MYNKNTINNHPMVENRRLYTSLRSSLPEIVKNISFNIFYISWTSDVRSAYVKKQSRTHPNINCFEYQWFEYSYSNNLIIHIYTRHFNHWWVFFYIFSQKNITFHSCTSSRRFPPAKKLVFSIYISFSIYTLRKKNFFLETSLIGKTKTFVQRSTLGLLSMPIKTI